MLKRLLVALFVLIASPALALGGGFAALQTHSGTPALPALTTGGFGACCVRMHFPNANSVATTTSNDYVLSNMHTVAPPWANGSSVWMFYDPAFHLNGNSVGIGAEQPGLNPLQIVWQTACIDPTCSGGAWPVTFNTALTVVMGGVNDGSYGIAQGFHPSAGAGVWLRTMIHVVAPGQYPVGLLLALQGDDMSEGRVGFSADQPSLRLTGTVTGGNTGNAVGYSAAFALVSGYDGTTPAPILFGTSRTYALNEYDYKLATQGATGGIERALTSSTGGTQSTMNFSADGAYTARALGQGVTLRRTAILQAPNFPFTSLHTDNNVNDINNGGGPTSLAGIQKLDFAFWNYWHGFCNCPIYHYSGEPWANTTSDNSLWGNVPGQVPLVPSAALPNGLQWQTNAWLNANVGLPSFVKTVDDGAAYQDTVQKDHWQAPGINGTLTADCAQGSRSCSYSLSAIPNAGDAMVLDYEVAGTVENIQENKVTCTGSGPYLCTILTGASTARLHSSGAAVYIAYNHDGVHELSTLAKAAAVIIEALKVAGFFPK